MYLKLCQVLPPVLKLQRDGDFQHLLVLIFMVSPDGRPDIQPFLVSGIRPDIWLAIAGNPARIIVLK